MTVLHEAWTDAQGSERVRGLFEATFGRSPEGVWAAPGRVNLIGEHVDYNGGLCLPIALPHRTFVAARRRDDDVVRLVSALDPADVWSGTVDGIAPGTVGGWVAYAAGPVWALTQEGHAPAGFEAAIDSCVPLGAGLSSSAAIECAVSVALDDLWVLGLTSDDSGRARLAAACVRAENEIAQAPTGGMDQAASMRAQDGHALLLDCRDGSIEQVPFTAADVGLTVLVIDTKAPHALVDGQYAVRRRTCEDAAVRLGVATLREVPDPAAAAAAFGPQEQEASRRVRHVITEIDRVRQVAGLLREGQISDLGPLLNASHESLRHDYEVSCPELDTAVAAARSAGAIGARMTGGGFGGSAIALLPIARIEETMTAVTDAFAQAGFAPPEFLIATPSAAAGRVGGDPS